MLEGSWPGRGRGPHVGSFWNCCAARADAPEDV